MHFLLSLHHLDTGLCKICLLFELFHAGYNVRELTIPSPIEKPIPSESILMWPSYASTLCKARVQA